MMSTFPNEYTLSGFPLPEEDQGERDTCVAFCVTSLLKYYCGVQDSFSAQYLYACCKCDDNEDDDSIRGTSLDQAFRCLRKYGMIYDKEWPYNPCETDTQAQIDKERLSGFSPFFFDPEIFKMLLTPQNIEEYKGILSGANGKIPMPVIVGLNLYSTEQIQDDWLRMPLAWEQVQFGHAMLIFGYKEATYVPGGGYFIAQNSWAKNSFMGNSNIVKIPFEYIKNDAVQAGTIQTTTPYAQAEAVSADSGKPDPVEKYIRTATRDMQDFSGVFTIKSGDKIIEDPSNHTAALDTQENRNMFIRNGFNLAAQIPDSLKKALERADNYANLFGTALDVNLVNNVGQIMPNMNLPVWVNFIPWPFQVKFRSCKKIETDEDALTVFLEKKGLSLSHEHSDLTAKELILNANLFHVYELSCGSIVFRIVVLFVSPIDGKTLELRPADRECYEAVMKFYREWERGAGISKANCQCFVLGTPLEWNNVAPVMRHDNVQCLCAPAKGEAATEWIVAHRSEKTFSFVLQSFIYSLYPETVADRYDRVQKCVDNEMLFYHGNISVERIVKKIRLPELLVEQCFDMLQEHGDYENYISRNGEKSIRKRKAGVAVKHKILFFVQKNAFTKILYSLLLSLVYVSAWLLRSKILDWGRNLKVGLLFLIIILTIVTYLASCLQGVFQRKLTK